jgi:hypothetical protein
VHRAGPDTDKYGRKLRVVERNGRSLRHSRRGGLGASVEWCSARLVRIAPESACRSRPAARAGV